MWPACLSRIVFVVLDFRHPALAARQEAAQHNLFVALFPLFGQVMGAGGEACIGHIAQPAKRRQRLAGKHDHIEQLIVQARLLQRM